MDTEQLVKEAQAAMGKGSVEERAEKVKLVLECSGCEHEGALVHASSLQQLVSARKAETEAACTLSFGEQRENAYARLSRTCEACIHMALSSASALASVRPLRRTEGLALCDAIEELLCIDPRMEEQWEAHPQLLHSFLQSALSIAPSYIARALLSELTSRDFFPQPIPNRMCVHCARRPTDHRKSYLIAPFRAFVALAEPPSGSVRLDWIACNGSSCRTKTNAPPLVSGNTTRPTALFSHNCQLLM